MKESFLVFSDVHLGSDLNDAGKSVPRSKAIDDDLAALLAHYRKTPPQGGGRWRVIIAGDFIDFIGISIDPREEDKLETELTASERRFGLGGAEDHVLVKLRRTAKRHANVFAELGAFVAEGHSLTCIQGNHDLELHWPRVQREFCVALASAASADADVDAIAGRVEFRPWFFHRDGLVFIEHGHQYDPFCATPFILAPLNPRDPKRVNPTLSDSLLRHIVRRTPGMKEYGHEDRGLASYISWGLMLGARGTIDLFSRFFFIVGELRSIARAYTSETGKTIADEHEKRLCALAKSANLSEQSLRDALALHVTPLGATPRGVLASVMLDRLSFTAAMVLLAIALGLSWSLLGSYAIPLLIAFLATWVVLHIIVARGRPSVDPTVVMENRAAALSKLFPASFIVMGHTHVPATKDVGEDATYINLGSWAEEEPDPKDGDVAKAYRAARTHLVIEKESPTEEATDHKARLCEWRGGAPKELHSRVRQIRSESVAAAAE